jgi:putative ABC transport system ATP-binding protein
MLKISALTVIKEQKTILKDLELAVEKGEKIVILGESGSGKSTLLKTILYFELPQTGQIIYHNEQVSAENINNLRRDFVYIGQKAPVFLDSVKDYFYLPFHYRSNRHLKPDLNTLNLELQKYSIPPDIMAQEYNDLSGGEQQRITIIRALMLNRPVYLLDEITSNLDSENADIVLQNILTENERSIIYVTHNLKHVDRFDRALLLKDGFLKPWSRS